MNTIQSELTKARFAAFIASLLILLTTFTACAFMETRKAKFSAAYHSKTGKAILHGIEKFAVDQGLSFARDFLADKGVDRGLLDSMMGGINAARSVELTEDDSNPNAIHAAIVAGAGETSVTHKLANAFTLTTIRAAVDNPTVPKSLVIEKVVQGYMTAAQATKARASQDNP